MKVSYQTFNGFAKEFPVNIDIRRETNIATPEIAILATSDTSKSDT